MVIVIGLANIHGVYPHISQQHLADIFGNGNVTHTEVGDVVQGEDITLAVDGIVVEHLDLEKTLLSPLKISLNLKMANKKRKQDEVREGPKN